MFGVTEGAILVLAVTATFTDLAWGKIYNWLTVPAFVLGIAYNSVNDGWMGAGNSLAGGFAGLLLYGWMFWLRMMGGGDIKLIMAFGAWGGLHYVEEVAILGILLGGIMSIVILTFKGKIFGFLKQMYQFLISVFIKELEVQFPKIDRKLTMPFGLAISVAAILTSFYHPLLKWGFSLWP